MSGLSAATLPAKAEEEKRFTSPPSLFGAWGCDTATGTAKGTAGAAERDGIYVLSSLWHLNHLLRSGGHSRATATAGTEQSGPEP